MSSLLALDLQPGDQLCMNSNKTLVVERFLRAGDHGEVWLCQTSGGEHRAVKLLPCEQGADTSEVAKEVEIGQRSAKAVGGFHVPMFYEASIGRKLGQTSSDVSFLMIVMEYIHGKTVRELVSKDSPLPHYVAMLVIHDICLVLASLHKGGIIHRNVIADSIIISSTGHAYLTDYGLSKVSEEAERQDPSSRPMKMRGTPIYMAPEMCLPLDPAAAADAELDKGLCMSVYSDKVDIWALGIVAMQMAVGEAPLEANGVSQLETKDIWDYIMRSPPPRLSAADAEQYCCVYNAFTRLTLCRDPNTRCTAEQLHDLTSGNSRHGSGFEQIMRGQTARWFVEFAEAKRAAGAQGWDDFA